MEPLNNNQDLVNSFEDRGDRLTLGVRDFAGWILVLGFLLTVGAWQFNWLSNVLSSVLSVLFLFGAGIALLGLPISQLLHRDEPELYYQWAQYKKLQQ